MNYNPYAAPQAPPPQPMPAGPDGYPQPWDLGEVLGLAWERFTAHWVVLVFSLVILIAISAVPILMMLPLLLPLFGDLTPLAVVKQMNSGPAQWWIRGIGLGMVFFETFFRAGLLKIWLAAARNETPTFGDLFAGGSRYLPLLGFNLLVYIPYQIAYLLLGLPAFGLWLASWSAELFIVDAGLGPIDALSAHFRVMRGQWGMVALLGLIGLLLYIGGFIGCCVGMLVTFPIYEVARSIVFVRISGRGQARALPQAHPPPGGYVPPPGYGGGWQPPPQ